MGYKYSIHSTGLACIKSHGPVQTLCDGLQPRTVLTKENSDDQTDGVSRRTPVTNNAVFAGPKNETGVIPLWLACAVGGLVT
jgi:hypothetical protein